MHSLENTDGGKKEGVPCAIREKEMFDVREGTAQLSPGGLGPTQWGAFLALKPDS